MIRHKNITPESRVWVYQSNRPFTAEEEREIVEKGGLFVQEWASHNRELKAFIEIRYHQFIILAVDERYNTPGGCSIDKSIHFIRSIEENHRVSLLDRMNFAYRDAEGVKVCRKVDFENLVQQGIINDATIVFNNLVLTGKELETRWEIPFSESWHSKMFIKVS